MLKEAVENVRKRRRRRKSRSVVDSAARNAAALSDGCNPELVKGARFDGLIEIPLIKKPESIIVPDALVPFSKMEKANPKAFAVCEYENDTEFKDILVNPKEYVRILKRYQGFVSPDCSVYRDMPLSLQITNIYRSRAIGFFFQKNGVYVIPCVRWGDERTYTTKTLPEKVAFLGVEKHSIVSIGSYGQIKDRVNRYYFEAGMESMMETLEPEIVLVYGKMSNKLKEKYSEAKFVEYPDWTRAMRNK